MNAVLLNINNWVLRRQYLGSILAVLVYMDLLTTLIMVNEAGVGIEVNPLLHWVMVHCGIAAFAIIKLTTAGFALMLDGYVQRVVFVLCLIYGVLVTTSVLTLMS